MRIIGIESSCDETVASVIEDGRVLSDVVASQTAVYRPYGGMVPEIASRQYLANIVPINRESLAQAGVGLRDLDCVAATACPGLKSALLLRGP